MDLGRTGWRSVNRRQSARLSETKKPEGTIPKPRAPGTAIALLLRLLLVGRVEGSEPEPLAFSSSEGWRLVILGPAKREALESVLKAVCLIREDSDRNDIAKLYKPMLVEEDGFRLTCEFELNGCKVEIWRDSHAVVKLRSSRELRSVAFVASVDGLQTTIHDNRRIPFVVSERGVHAYEGRGQRVYLKCPVSFSRREAESVALVGVNTKGCGSGG